MTTKSCGTCEFWDRENAFNNLAFDKMSECLNEKSDFRFVYKVSNLNCPVYKEIKEE